jgi:acyl-CoA reductase-like NAD-dependent aldehyde dehydrogenase
MSALSLPDTALFVATQRIDDGARAAVVNPWTTETIAHVVLANADHAERAAKAARESFEVTRRMSSQRRQRLLEGIVSGILSARTELAALITAESGKPTTFALAEVDRALMTFQLGASEAVRLGGEVIPLDVTEATEAFRGSWQRVPRGPVLAITPFNFPLNLVAHKVAPALACGATVVLKPAPQTPLTALKFGEIVRAACAHAGAPEDCLQVLPCDNEVAERLVRHDAFSVLSFTGSDRIGWYLKSIAGKKHVMLELGGNAACIIHNDATRSLAEIAGAVCASAFAYAGQVCIKTQRLYLEASIAEAFLAELVPRAAACVPRDPSVATTIVGPMIDERSACRVEAWVEQARAAGATLLVEGPRAANRYPACVVRIEGDGHGLDIVEQEAFGPVLTVHVYDTWNNALAMAGRTRYGLQAGIYTDSNTRIRQAYDGLAVGGLIVNGVPSTRVDSMPYGGFGDSGIGREGVRYAMEEMTDRKLLAVRV